MTKGYKATHNYKCRNQTYEIGQEYKLDFTPIICSKGFHYCLNAKNTLNYYSYTNKFKLLEIEDLSNDTVTNDDKSCSNHIRIVREITDLEELFQLLGCVYTYNKKGQELTYKNLNNYWRERTYNESGQELTYKTSDGYWCEYTYNENSKLLKYKNSNNYWREYRYDENNVLMTVTEYYNPDDEINL